MFTGWLGCLLDVHDAPDHLLHGGGAPGVAAAADGAAADARPTVATHQVTLGTVVDLAGRRHPVQADRALGDEAAVEA